MTKKKTLLLISLAFAVVMLISSVMLFYAYMPSVNFRETYRMVNDNIDYAISQFTERNKSREDFEQNIDDLFFGISNYTNVHFPMMYFWADAETGEIVRQSESYIAFRKNVDDEFNYLRMNDYLTSNIKKQIADYRDSTKQKFFYIYRMSFNISSGEYIPVEMEIGFYNLHKSETIKFTDLEPQLEIKENQEFFLFNYVFYDLDEDHFNHRYYNKLRTFAAEISHEIKSGKNIGGGGYTGSDMAYYTGTQEVGERKYVSCVVAMHSKHYDTLKHTSFKESAVLLIILFVLIYGVVIIVASKLYDKNQKLNKSLRAFTSAAAHELKTPLAVIQNQCECIIENIAPEKNGEYIKSVYDEAVRMNSIVTSFLQYNRLVNAEKLPKEKCDFKEIVIAEMQKYKDFAAIKGAEMMVEITTAESIIICNRDLISMAIDNYLSNAIKYATGEKKVTVKLEKNRFSVYNTSEGISRESAEALWDILSRESASRTKDGTSTGMGLPICAEIFKAHGFNYGFINIKDGVEFYFSVR